MDELKNSGTVSELWILNLYFEKYVSAVYLKPAIEKIVGERRKN